MSLDFSERVRVITQEARQYIISCISKHTKVILFTSSDNQESGEEWTEDIYEMPEFHHYDKYDYCQCAAIQELFIENDRVCIIGVLKGDSYPDKVTVNIYDLGGESLIDLADYLEYTLSEKEKKMEGAE